jgi:hypothetical protein
VKGKRRGEGRVLSPAQGKGIKAGLCKQEVRTRWKAESMIPFSRSPPL